MTEVRASPSLSARFFRWHRCLGYLVALQVLAWVLGGALFAWLPFQAWVKSAASVSKPSLSLPADWAQALARSPLAGQPVQALSAVATASGPAFKLRTAQGEQWLLASGGPLPAPTAGIRPALLHSVEPAHTRIIGSPEQLPRRPPQVKPASTMAPPVQPTVMVEEGVQVYRVARRQPHSAWRPSLLPEVGQARVMPLPEPASVTPASVPPPPQVRVQPPKTGMQSLALLGPLALPAAQVPKVPHQPQRLSAAHAEQVV